MKRLEQSLLTVNKVATRRLYKQSGLSAVEFVETIVVPALEGIGSAWENGEAALSQVYMSGRICEDLIAEVLPSEGSGGSGRPSLAIAVLLDSHMLGKRIVSAVLRANGYQVLDYGQVGVDELVARVAQDGVRLLLVSTLMLPSALKIKELRARLDALPEQVKLVVGGAPFRFDPNLWREVGADATSPTASGVVAVLKELSGGVA